MIKKLKIKFILLSLSSLLILLSLIVAGMNLINYSSLVQEADEILSLLSQNKGKFPVLEEMEGFEEANKTPKLPPHLSPELPYESRYFSVLLDASGRVIHTETSKIASVDTAEAVAYAKQVSEQDKLQGFADQFRFVRTFEGETERITFLDCGRKLDTFRQFLLISAVMALVGFVAVAAVICFLAERIIRPIAESYEKQRRFITDAGHEIKTPLTVIQANAALLEMELGENENVNDITQQTQRLATLTDDLIRLARMEEAEAKLPMVEFPLSDVVEETVHSFRHAAQARSSDVLLTVQPFLSCKGNAKSIEQLVGILMDNAVKYCKAGEPISVQLKKAGRWLTLSVCNPTEQALDRESLSHVFDRFYRMDPSRSSDKGGYGIGLSVAHAIVQAHGGKIQAWTEDGSSFGITVSLPS